MTRYCPGIDYDTAWAMPVEIRRWWIERTNKSRKEEAKARGELKEGHVDPHGVRHE